VGLDRSSRRQGPQGGSTPPSGWRHPLWLGLLVAASVAFSLGFACAVPLAAFGGAAALTLNRRDALLLTAAVWLANQLLGFVVLGYPWTAETFAWGIALGAVALLATVASQLIVRRLADRGGAVIALATFIGAFAIYQGGLFVVAATLLGGIEDFAPAIVGRILAINAGAFAGLLALHRLATTIGLAARPAVRFSGTERPA
jgi:hypothetical protein